MDINKLYQMDCIEYMKTLPNECVDLIVADPPYFRILKNEDWDRFDTIENYYNFSEEWIENACKKLRLSGTLLLYGCTRNFSTLCNLNNIMIKNGMYFVEEIIIDKGIKSIAGRISNKIKMLPPVSENILVYRKDAKPFVKKLLNTKQKEFGYKTSYIKEFMGMASNGGGNWTKYCGNTEFPLLPTEEHWNKLCKLFEIDIKYKEIQETYNGKIGLTNVWNDINFYIKNRQHPCQKPLGLCDRIIQIFSNENDLVYIPFAGSGSEIVSCINNNRNWIGTEINGEYIDIINKRINDLNK